eukprot:CAMPEP_0194197080 /NCGR_PEP_ID=MMETSP0154-20130528/77014_1 /TAXON_ID=1049557 /ORGANISM="Thalassiothrix antarctica, Strain L6-D1" /LENGTH=149 /DNA_ID=CAMNT_0038921725 /DNA_START=184 /DNA_END=633 /DNA_ORIENTATION=+
MKTVKKKNSKKLSSGEKKSSGDIIDIEFTFELVTLSEEPDVSKYLRAAELIIGKNVRGSAYALSIQSRCDKDQVEKPEVHHHTVTATMSVKKNGNDVYRENKRRILRVLKNAVNDGSVEHIPKSESLTLPSECSNILAGLMSRWRRPSK